MFKLKTLTQWLQKRDTWKTHHLHQIYHHHNPRGASPNFRSTEFYRWPSAKYRKKIWDGYVLLPRETEITTVTFSEVRDWQTAQSGNGSCTTEYTLVNDQVTETTSRLMWQEIDMLETVWCSDFVRTSTDRPTAIKKCIRISVWLQSGVKTKGAIFPLV